MLYADADERWTLVHRNPEDPLIRRYPVPGGWLYQVSCVPYDHRENAPAMWHPPVFVPDRRGVQTK